MRLRSDGRKIMNRVVLGITGVAAILAALMLEAADRPGSDAPQFTADGQLVRPNDYREWVYLSSGLGMVYGPAAEGASDAAPRFDNASVIPRLTGPSSRQVNGPTKRFSCWKSGRPD